MRAFDFAPPTVDFFDRLLVTAKSDGRFRYLIHRGRIYRAATGFEPEPYKGAPHDTHIHVSFTPAGDLDRRHFALPILGSVAPVREAQTLLALLFERLAGDGYGFPGLSAGKVDGLLGPRTKAALHAYQCIKGIAVTSQPDGATLDALRAEPRSFG